MCVCAREIEGDDNMAASTVDLAALAASTTAALTAVWDTIGVGEAARVAFLSALQVRVSSLYTSSVAEQEGVRDALVEEIAGLTDTITNMQTAMEQAVSVVRRRLGCVRAGQARCSGPPLPHNPPPPPPPHSFYLQVTQGSMPLEPYRNALEAQRVELQGVWDAREAELKALEGEVFALIDDVDEAIGAGFTAIGDRMTAGRVAAYRDEIARLTTLKAERGGRIAALADEVAELWNEMEFEAAAGDDVEAAIAGDRAGLRWGQAVIDVLADKVATLTTEKAAREERISGMGKQVTELWKRLSTPEAEQTAFLEEHAGLGEDTIAAVAAYLAAKQEEFRARLVELVAGARRTIDGLWTEMRAGDAQRHAMFPPYYADDAPTDDLFQVHEAYIAQLGTAVEDLRPILKGIEKREELKADRAEYEAIIADASRLLARGNSSARLKEEKLERRVKKELPAVTKKLRDQIKEWEARSGRPFTVDDDRFLDALDAEEAAEVKAKGDARAAREAAKGGSGAAAAAAASGGGGGGGSAAPTAPVAPAAGMSRSTSAGRMSVYRGSMAPSAATAAMSATVGAKKTAAAPPAPATRKTSATAAAGSLAAAAAAAASTDDSSADGSENAAPVDAKRRPGTATSAAAAVAAPPLRDATAAARAAAATAPTLPAAVVKGEELGVTVAVSDAAKSAAAKMLAAM